MRLCFIIEGKLDSKDASPRATRRVKEDVIKCLELKESLSSSGSTEELDAKKVDLTFQCHPRSNVMWLTERPYMIYYIGVSYII